MKRPAIKILVLIFAAAVIIRLLAALTRPMVQLDEAVYARLAENLAAGKGAVDLTGATSAHFSPLFPLILAVVGLVLNNYVLAGYITVIIFGSLIVVPTFLLGRDLFSERIGLMAAALIAVVPLFVDYSSRLYSESVYVFFLLLVLWFGWWLLKEGRPRDGVYAGLALGAAYLGNPSAVFYLVVFTALALIVGRKKRALRAMAGAVGLFLACFMLFAVPYIIFIHSVSGQWTYTGKKADEQIFAASRNLRYGSPEWEKRAMTLTDDGQETWLLRAQNSGDLMSFFVQHPRAAAKTFVTESYVFYSEQLERVLPLWLLPLIGLGLFVQVWERRRSLAIGYIAIMLAPVPIILAMYATDRFFMPFLPLALILVALGWQRWEDWAGETVLLSLPSAGERWRRLSRWAVGALVIIPVLVYAVSGVASQGYDTQYREAGEWIKAETGSGKVIMSRWEATSPYYAGGISITLPYADYDRTAAYARAKGIDYLVIGSQVVRDTRPDLSRLLEDDASHPEWKLVHVVRPGTDQETLIFQRN